MPPLERIVMMKLWNTRKTALTPAQREGAPPKKRRLGQRLIALTLVVTVVGVAAWRLLPSGAGGARAADITYTTQPVARRDITHSLTGSGTLAAANSYSVTSLTSGEILSADFEEGDVVEKDSILYQLDSSDAANSIQTNEISLGASQRSYQQALDSQKKLSITAPAGGSVVSLEVEVGDEVTAQTVIATIRDSGTMTLKVPFPADDAAGFAVGQGATVTLDGSFETLDATVSAISGTDTVGTGNMITRQVTLEVRSPGGLASGQLASATIGGATSSGSGAFAYRTERTVTAGTAGTISSLSVQEGDTVTSGQTLARLSSDSVDNNVQSQQEALRRAELSLQNAQKALDDYTITSPISGTVVDKLYKAGESAEQNKTLCTIYDMSYFTFTLNVDELDIADVAVGQTVTITADAAEGKTYTGTVTKVSVAGATASGVTTYPVTVRIDETTGLLPGMNVDATIEIEGAADALTIPIQALSRGNKVLVTTDSPSAASALEDEAPEGYVYVQVETGLSDEDDIQILSGLTEGDTVAYLKSSGDDSTQMGMEGMVMAGGGTVTVMPSGTPPSGGGGGRGGF